MASDNDSAIEISSPDTQFIPKEGDEENLWSVIEITSENSTSYKVKWDGLDPATKRPWPQSWVPKHDCTDDIVHEWKLKQAKSKKKATKKASARRQSTKSKSSLSSTVSGATTSTTTSTTTAKRGSTNATLPADDNEPLQAVKVKRKRNSALFTVSRTEDLVPPTRPKKKRKVEIAEEASPSQNPSSYEVRTTHMTKVLYKEDEDKNDGKNASFRRANGKLIERIPPDIDSDYDSVPAQPPPNKITKYFGESEADVVVKSRTKAKGKEKDSFISPTTAELDADDIPLPKNGRKLAEKEPQTKKLEPKKSSRLTISRLEDETSRKAKTAISRNNSHKSVERNVEQLDNDLPVPVVRPSIPSRLQSKKVASNAEDSDNDPPAPVVHPPIKSRVQRKKIMHDAEDSDNNPSARVVHPWIPKRRKITDDFDDEIPLPRKPLASKASLTSRTITKPHKISTPTIKPARNSDDQGSIQPTSSSPPVPENNEDHHQEEVNWDYPDPVEDHIPQPSPRALKRLDAFDSIVNPVRQVVQEVHENEVPTDEDRDQDDNEQSAQAHTTLPLFIPHSSDSEDFAKYATPSPKPPTNGRTSSYRHDDSYTNDVVPETEPENTESQESRPEASAGAQPLTPARPTLKSKMKPKTPGGSKTSVIDDNPHSPYFAAAEPNTRNVKLAPIPVISPSTFAPLLPSSNINNSTIESADAEDEPMSSIEQFDSPVKSSQLTKDPVLSGIYSEIDKGWELVNKKGEMMAENARKERLRVEKMDIRTKISLDNIVKVAPSTKGKEKLATSTDQFDSAAAQELEDAYVDLSGGAIMDAGESQDPAQTEHPEFLREEEEESTQDIIQEMESRRHMSDADVVGWHHPDSEYHQEDKPREDSAPPAKQGAHQSGDVDMDNGDSLEVVANVSTQPTNLLPSGETHSPSPVRPEENTHDAEEEIPATAPTKARAASSRRSSYSEISDEYRYNHPVAMNLLNIKSNEIARLEQLLAEALRKNRDLTTEYVTIENALVEAQLREQDPRLGHELEETRSTLTAEREKWATDRQKHSAELETAKTLVAEETRKKLAAEERATLFETHYHQATAFVTSVREENAALEKRAQIAEGQAQTGVASAKVFFEKRTKDLEADLVLWKNTTRFVLEKDSRTNDEVRRRAAEAPELEARCDRLEEKLETLYDRISELEEEVSNKTDELDSVIAQKDGWSIEANRLNKAMLEMTAKYEDLAREHNLVYRCEWRINNDQDSCDAIFLTTEDLQNHLFSSGHLKDPNS